MVRMFVRHRVKDYRTWRRFYDEAVELREKHGVLGSGVYRTILKPEEITVWHDFESAANADAFAGRAELRNAMASAGVLEAPTIWVTEEV